MGLHVEIDRDCCMSSGRCVADEPEAFAFDDDELARVLPGAAELSDERLITIARRCPGLAIGLRGADGEIVEVA